FVNPAAAQMVGWSAEELIGQSMHVLVHHSHSDGRPYSREACPIYAAFQDGIVHRVTDEVFWRKDGTSFPVEYISTPMHDEQGKLIGAVVAFRDITQRKWAEAVLQRTNEELEHRVRDRTSELRQANEQLKELNELRSRVLSMVCHEFRNPLNNILLSVSSLERYQAQLSQDQQESYLAGITDNVDRMTQMIDAILLIGKVEAQGLEVRPCAFDLVAFCRELVAETATSLGRDTVHFSCRFKQMTVTLDPQLLRSILSNVLGNAIRYSANESPIQFKLLKRNPHVIFRVIDQGIGIPPEDLPYLFEPFHRGRNVSNISGTGLGLNIVKRFLDLQRGRVEVTSVVGKGTTFILTLPCHYA
ncbi:MAG TPA: PAS domain-containing sensor histidine kinase, partial [Leptolyngbyaceae cyanobacterium]